MNETEERRFWSKVDASGDCWEWTATLYVNGYGMASAGGRSVRAHRLAWEHLVGPIADGLVIDHLCRNRRCVNPDHLEPVTHRENVLRGVGITAQAARKTNCPEGHPYEGENLGGKPRARRCKVCTRVAVNNRRQALKMRLANGGPTTIQHGTISAYTVGCRCDPCRSAMSAYRRDRKVCA
jgi:hypothetical protein